MASALPKYYWDACIWITLIAERRSVQGKACEHLFELARAGKCEIWTSSFCLAEVVKRKCDGQTVGLVGDQDVAFEDLIEQEYVKKVSVDVDVGKVARRLLRKFPQIGKPQDAVHIATCLLNNIDELHTFDREDMLGLDGQLEKLDRSRLKICAPPSPPEEPQGDMFENGNS